MESEEKIKHFENLERRIEKLELFSHPPIDWKKRIKYLEDAYMRLYDLFKKTIKELQMDWIISNWTLCIAIFWMLEKVVKITPISYDDILLDIVWSGIRKAVKK